MTDISSTYTFNNVGGDQHNNNNTNYYYTTSTTPTSPDLQQALRSFNDAPLDLLSVNFTGRDDELAKIINSLSAAYDNVPARCAIVGMHGVGKSQVSAKLAKDTYTQGRYRNIVWMQGTTIEKLNQGFSKLLHLVGHPDRSDQDQSARLTAARRWLESVESGKWLLVVDNVCRETVEFIQEHLPRTNDQGNILFTTRTQGVAEALTRVAGEQHGIVELGIPDVEDAVKLLVQQLKGNEIDVDPVKAQEVVKSVGCLPLAISQAAAFVKETGGSLDDLMSLFKSEHKIDLMQWENDLSHYQEKSIAATFVSQLNDLERTSPDASLLLHVIALFDPERIPLSMLTTGARLIALSHSQQASDAVPATKPSPLHGSKNHIWLRRELDSAVHFIATGMKFGSPKVPPFKKQSLLHKIKNQLLHRKELDLTNLTAATSSTNSALPNSKLTSLLALIQSPTAFQNAIRQLQNRSLIKRRYNGPSSSLWIHDLVRFIVLQHAKSSDGEHEYVDCAVQVISSTFGQIEEPTLPESWPIFEALIPHVQSLTSREDVVGSGSLISVNTTIIEYLRCQGRLDEAETLGKQTVMNAERIRGSEHVITLAVTLQLAMGYAAGGRVEEAEALVTRVLREQEKQLGPENSSTLRTMVDLSDIYSFQGRYPEAETLLNQVLLSRRKQLGSEHLDTVRAMYRLAGLYQTQGRLHDAKTLTQQVLLVQEKQLGPEHVRTLATISQLAELYQLEGRYNEAEALYDRVVASTKKQLGPGHFHVCFTMIQLASVYRDQGRYLEAKTLLEQSIEGMEKQLGSDHIVSLFAAIELAFVSRDQGRYDDAEKQMLQILPSIEKRLGPDHVEVLSSTSKLACIYHEQGRCDEAEKLFDQVLASVEEQLGSEHIDTLSIVSGLGCLYRTQGRYAEAEKLLERVLNGVEKQLGSEHVVTFRTMCDLARVYHHLGQESKAATLFDQARVGQEKQLGSRHVETLDTMHYLASFYNDQGRHDEAEKLLVDVLARREEVLGISHPHTVETITLLADVYTKQGRLDDAQSVRQRAVNNP